MIIRVHINIQPKFLPYNSSLYISNMSLEQRFSLQQAPEDEGNKIISKIS